MRAPRGRVADVVRFSWVDGPGNRFVVFLQGCNFDCLACHNPHTIPVESVHARTVEVAELVDEVRAVAPYLSGVTASGGEATQQADFVHALFAALGADPDLARLTRFVDSNGACPGQTWQQLLPVTDGVMLDLKAWHPQRHRELTGSGNEQVLASLRQVAEAGRLYEIRLLLVPGVNDDEAALRSTAAWLTSVDPDVRVKVIGFRRHGVRSEAAAWRETEPADLARYRELLTDAGIRRLEVV